MIRFKRLKKNLFYLSASEPVPIGVNGTNNFIFNSLQPYIFIRAMDGSTNLPWTRTSLQAQNSSTFLRSWTMTNRIQQQYNQNVPVSDLPWTCPFGAQFQFENYIPGPGGE